MNIREHIEAGHYRLKREGYTVVPTRSGREVLIIATDYRNPDFPGWPILGILLHKRERDPECWRASGGFHNEIGDHTAISPLDLLPPPPRSATQAARWARAVLSRTIVLAIFNAVGGTMEVARRFNVPPSSVSGIRLGQRWRSAGAHSMTAFARDRGREGECSFRSPSGELHPAGAKRADAHRFPTDRRM